MAEALTQADGLTTQAARILGCGVRTVQRYLKRFPDLHEIRDDVVSTMLDEAEGGLGEAVRKGDPWAIRFVLRTLGKNRGYTYREELTGADGAPLPGAVLILPDNGRKKLPARNPGGGESGGKGE